MPERGNRPRMGTLFLFGLALVVLAVDQATKYVASANIPLGGFWTPVPALDGIVGVTHITNSGAAFGLFPSQTVLFTLIAIVVVGFIVAYQRQLSEGEWLLRVTLGLQLGGALGNLVDRLRFASVVDIVDLRFWPFDEFPIFNFADSAIVVGVLLTVLGLLLPSLHQSKPANSIRDKAL